MRSLLFTFLILLNGVVCLSNTNYSVTTTNVNLREASTVSSKSLGIIAKGDTVKIISKGPKWSKVNFKNLEGYISTPYLLDIQSDNKNKNITIKEGFSDIKGFTAGFKYVFFRVFIIAMLIIGGYVTKKNRMTDARYKNGFRQGKLSNFTILKIAIYSSIIALIIGLFGGIICLFH